MSDRYSNWVEFFIPESHWSEGNIGIQLLRRAHERMGGGADFFPGNLAGKPIKIYFHGPRHLVAGTMVRARKMEELSFLWWADSL